MKQVADSHTRRHATRAIAFGASLALCVGAVACGSDDDSGLDDDVRTVASDVADVADEATRDVVELAARNFASLQGGQEFDRVGHPLTDDLSCTAAADDGLTDVELECSGTTTAGGDALLTGTTAEIPGASFDELEGEFIGTVDGETVFETDRLGD